MQLSVTGESPWTNRNSETDDAEQSRRKRWPVGHSLRFSRQEGTHSALFHRALHPDAAPPACSETQISIFIISLRQGPCRPMTVTDPDYLVRPLALSVSAGGRGIHVCSAPRSGLQSVCLRFFRVAITADA